MEKKLTACEIKQTELDKVQGGWLPAFIALAGLFVGTVAVGVGLSKAGEQR